MYNTKVRATSFVLFGLVNYILSAEVKTGFLWGTKRGNVGKALRWRNQSVWRRSESHLWAIMVRWQCTCHPRRRTSHQKFLTADAFNLRHFSHYLLLKANASTPASYQSSMAVDGGSDGRRSGGDATGRRWRLIVGQRTAIDFEAWEGDLGGGFKAVCRLCAFSIGGVRGYGFVLFYAGISRVLPAIFQLLLIFLLFSRAPAAVSWTRTWSAFRTVVITSVNLDPFVATCRLRLFFLLSIGEGGRDRDGWQFSIVRRKAAQVVGRGGGIGRVVGRVPCVMGGEIAAIFCRREGVQGTAFQGGRVGSRRETGGGGRSVAVVDVDGEIVVIVGIEGFPAGRGRGRWSAAFCWKKKKSNVDSLN